MLLFSSDDSWRYRSKKADGIKEPLEMHKSFLQKVITGVNFLLSPAANMLGTSRFFTGCMKWQHAVVLEAIWETDLIIIFLPA